MKPKPKCCQVTDPPPPIFSPKNVQTQIIFGLPPPLTKYQLVTVIYDVFICTL